MKKTIKELAYYFDEELDKKLPVRLLTNGDLLYYNYIVKHLPNGKWGVFNVSSKDLKNEFFLKSCALMAAKAYNDRKFNHSNIVEDLDNNYWSHFSDALVFTQNIKHASADKYPILLTRLDESTTQVEFFKQKIYSLFKLTFV